MGPTGGPSPPISRTSAPGMCAARYRPCSIEYARSSFEWSTRVGTRIDPRTSRRSISRSTLAHRTASPGPPTACIHLTKSATSRSSSRAAGLMSEDFPRERRGSPGPIHLLDARRRSRQATHRRGSRGPTAREPSPSRRRAPPFARAGAGEHRRHGEARLEPRQHGPFRSDGFHHSAHVLHLRFECKLLFSLDNVIGQSRAASVQEDQPAERRKCHREGRRSSRVPDRSNPEARRHDDEIHRTVAGHLVSDVHAVGGLRVAGLRHVHISYP